ncbi:hypothetical protein BpHYR1_002460 [Brachionus plicatilis]|uniref:Uncharacterized protein n=1 Tax=Brachionus plicatilis TaxID=10195 RepID=A0A3M7SB57_BRAPC|nr:hypothetical protein BpHYR1_002460 [Brachionus plicatilis]
MYDLLMQKELEPQMTFFFENNKNLLLEFTEIDNLLLIGKYLNQMNQIFKFQLKENTILII